MTRSGYQSGNWRTDAEAINLENAIAPNAIYRPGESPLRVSGTAKARIGDVLCFSGVKTDKVRCRKVLSQYTAVAARFRQRVYLVPFGADHGDSGAPVWVAGTGAAVGMIEGGPRGKSPLTYVTPLLNMPNQSVAHAPGALAAPGMYDLHVITGE